MMLTKPSGIKRAALAAVESLAVSRRAAVESLAASALTMAAAAAGFAALAGCGFHLEGAESLPPAMGRTYIEAPDRNSEFFTSLRDALRLRGSEIVSSREAADAVLSILMDDTGQRVLSVTARNVPREYEVFYSVSFALDAGERKVIEPESLVATRVYAWNENEVLGKSAEERILRQSLAQDLARRVVGRIAASGSGTATPSASPSSTPSASPSSSPAP
jgi:LPS-assembly lipoprotein